MSLHIHIEHLIVENAPFARSDAAAFRAELERELTVLATSADATAWSSSKKGSLHAASISPASSSLSRWAAHSAQSLFQAIAPPVK